MKRSFFKLVSIFLLVICLVASVALPASAAITNPVIGEELGGTAADSTGANDGSVFARYLIVIWRGTIFIGALLVLIFFIQGAIEWISAGGDSGKIQKARDRMTQSVIGLFVLVSSFAIIGLISQLFFPEFNLLNLTIPSALNTQVTPDTLIPQNIIRSTPNLTNAPK